MHDPPRGFRCLMVGLHGSWPEALRLQGQLMRQPGRVCLSSKEMTQLLDGALASTTPSDRISIAVLDSYPCGKQQHGLGYQVLSLCD